MATARCLSINFSSISSNCFSALRCCFNFGVYSKSSGGEKKLSGVELKSLSDSNNGGEGFDDNSLATLPIPTLLKPENIIQSTNDIQNPEPIWINSVSVSVLQNEDLRNDPYKNISQNLTTYNAPVSIDNSNSNAMIIIPSVVVNSNVQALDDIYWVPIDPLGYRNIQVGGGDIQFQMPIPINETVTQQPMTTPILANQSPRIFLEQEPIFEPIPLNTTLTTLVSVEGLQCLSAGVSTENSDGSPSPIQPNFGMHNDSCGAELEPPQNPISEYDLRIYDAFNGAKNDGSHSQANNEGGGGSGYRRTPSKYLIDSNLVQNRVAEEVVGDTYRTQPQHMTHEEYQQYMEKEEIKKNKEMAQSRDNDFFGNLLNGLMVNRTMDPQKLFDAISSGNFDELFSVKPPSPVMIPQNTGSNGPRRR